MSMTFHVLDVPSADPHFEPNRILGLAIRCAAIVDCSDWPIQLAGTCRTFLVRKCYSRNRARRLRNSMRIQRLLLLTSSSFRTLNHVPTKDTQSGRLRKQTKQFLPDQWCGYNQHKQSGLANDLPGAERWGASYLKKILLTAFHSEQTVSKRSCSNIKETTCVMDISVTLFSSQTTRTDCLSDARG